MKIHSKQDWITPDMMVVKMRLKSLQTYLPQQLYNLMSEFYAAKVKVTESQGNAVMLNTISQGSGDDSLYE